MVWKPCSLNTSPNQTTVWHCTITILFVYLNQSTFGSPIWKAYRAALQKRWWTTRTTAHRTSMLSCIWQGAQKWSKIAFQFSSPRRSCSTNNVNDLTIVFKSEDLQVLLTVTNYRIFECAVQQSPRGQSTSGIRVSWTVHRLVALSTLSFDSRMDLSTLPFVVSNTPGFTMIGVLDTSY